METLPLEILIIIMRQLSILQIKNLALTCKNLQPILLNYYFWKEYMVAIFPDYKLCDENLILDQVKYIRQIYKKNLVVHEIKVASFEVNLVTGATLDMSFLDKFNLKKQINDGDIVSFINKDFQLMDYIYIKNMNYIEYIEGGDISTYTYTSTAPKEIKFIDEFPIDYYRYRYRSQIFYFDITLYFDQIKKNLRRLDCSESFIH